MIFKDKIRMLAHRASWELHHGPIPEGLWVLHHCDNPACVNPSHLHLGDGADNYADMISRGRRSPLAGGRGATHGLAVLTAEQVLEMRARRQGGETLQNLAAAYRVSLSCVAHIANGTNWKHLSQVSTRRIASNQDATKAPEELPKKKASSKGRL